MKNKLFQHARVSQFCTENVLRHDRKDRNLWLKTPNEEPQPRRGVNDRYYEGDENTR